MTYLKLDEAHGGPLLINMAKVDRVTKVTGGKAKLWFSANDSDAVIVEQAFDYVQAELFHSGNLAQAMGIGDGY